MRALITITRLQVVLKTNDRAEREHEPGLLRIIPRRPKRPPFMEKGKVKGILSEFLVNFYRLLKIKEPEILT